MPLQDLETRNNSGVLNPNERYVSPNTPYWQGFATVEGKDYRVVGYLKPSRNAKKPEEHTVTMRFYPRVHGNPYEPR